MSNLLKSTKSTKSSSLLKYIKLNKDEFINFVIIVTILSLMISNNVFLIKHLGENLSLRFIKIFLFLFSILFLRLTLMKAIAFKEAFQTLIYLTEFEHFGFKAYQKLSYSSSWKKTKKIKKIPVYVISLFLYFITLSVIVYPNFWNFKSKKIESRFFGYRKKFEKMPFINVNFYRESIVLFYGNLFYIFTLTFLIYTNIFPIYYSLIVFWLAIINLLPIFGSEGLELYIKNRFLWKSSIFLLLTFFILSFLTNFIIFSISFLIIAVIALLNYLWKDYKN